MLVMDLLYVWDIDESVIVIIVELMGIRMVFNNSEMISVYFFFEFIGIFFFVMLRSLL